MSQLIFAPQWLRLNHSFWSFFSNFENFPFFRNKVCNLPFLWFRTSKIFQKSRNLKIATICGPQIGIWLEFVRKKFSAKNENYFGASTTSHNMWIRGEFRLNRFWREQNKRNKSWILNPIIPVFLKWFIMNREISKKSEGRNHKEKRRWVIIMTQLTL